MSESTPIGRYSERANDMSLGHQTFGQATVDCSFLARESHWGTFDQRSAGLLRLTLSFEEPDEYKLFTARVYLGFQPDRTGACPHVTHHIYPDVLCGPPISQPSSSSYSLMPSIEGGGVSIGNVGVSGSSQSLREVRWRLKASRLPDHDDNYTSAS